MELKKKHIGIDFLTKLTWMELFGLQTSYNTHGGVHMIKVEYL
jgi:hypothetical protein